MKHYTAEDLEVLAVVATRANAAVAAARAARDAKRAGLPATILRTLEPGQGHLFTQYVIPSQISSSVSRIAALHGRKFKCCRTPGGVLVERVL